VVPGVSPRVRPAAPPPPGLLKYKLPYFKTIAQLKAEGKLEDQEYMKRWLNSDENRFFRVRPGKV
jgi:hypothetical protein